MIYEDDRFIIYYNECDKKHLDKLIKIISNRLPKICNFFEINYDKKIIIKLYDNLEKYKTNIINSFNKEAQINNTNPREYQNWMIANTEDGNINMQSLDLVKIQDDYKNYTEEEFCYNACHEFTHLCQQYLNSENPGWFWELIATNIGNPGIQHESNDKFTLNDLNYNFDNIDGYGIVYKFGKYIFENYDKKQILEWIRDNCKFLRDIEDVYEKYNQNVKLRG